MDFYHVFTKNADVSPTRNDDDDDAGDGDGDDYDYYCYYNEYDDEKGVFT